MNTSSDNTGRALRPRSWWRATAIGLAGMALLAACGGDDDSTDATPAAAATVEASAPAAATTPAPTLAPVAAGDDYGYGVAPAPLPTVAPDAAPDAASSSATVATADTSIGTVLVDTAGMTLYAFTNDTAGKPTCLDGCAGAWPPALVDGELTFGDLDGSLFSTVENPDGTQLKVGDFPLYTFAGDAAPGDVTGQGSGGVWFAVAPDGTLID